MPAKVAIHDKSASHSIPTQSQSLLKALENERGGKSICLGQLIKSLPTAKTIFAAAPELQAELVRQVVEIFSTLGAETRPNANFWWGDPKLPWGSAEIAEKLLRRRLPFTDTMLSEMLEQLAGIGLLTTAVVPCLEKLISQVEKQSAERPMSPRLRKALARIANGLTGKKLSRNAARLWKQEEHTPVACDRKIATRIDRLLANRPH